MKDDHPKTKSLFGLWSSREKHLPGYVTAASLLSVSELSTPRRIACFRALTHTKSRKKTAMTGTKTSRRRRNCLTSLLSNPFERKSLIQGNYSQLKSINPKEQLECQSSSSIDYAVSTASSSRSSTNRSKHPYPQFVSGPTKRSYPLQQRRIEARNSGVIYGLHPYGQQERRITDKSLDRKVDRPYSQNHTFDDVMVDDEMYPNEMEDTCLGVSFPHPAMKKQLDVNPYLQGQSSGRFHHETTYNILDDIFEAASSITDEYSFLRDRLSVSTTHIDHYLPPTTSDVHQTNEFAEFESAFPSVIYTKSKASSQAMEESLSADDMSWAKLPDEERFDVDPDAMLLSRVADRNDAHEPFLDDMSWQEERHDKYVYSIPTCFQQDYDRHNIRSQSIRRPIRPKSRSIRGY